MKSKSKSKSKRPVVRGPQLEMVRERFPKAKGDFDPSYEVLPPPPSENALTAAGGAMAVVSFRLPARARAELDALVGAHVARTRAEVVRIAIEALAKTALAKAARKAKAVTS